jgi:hypothetical protein
MWKIRTHVVGWPLITKGSYEISLIIFNCFKIWYEKYHHTTLEVCFSPCCPERGNERQYAAILNKMHQIYSNYENYKISWIPKEKNTSSLPDAPFVTSRYYRKCTVPKLLLYLIQRKLPLLQHRSIETIKILGEYNPLRWNKNWSVWNDENTLIIQANNSK